MQPINYNDIDQMERRAIRAQYVAAQGGLCHYCKASLQDGPRPDVASKPINWKRFPANFLRYPVHLHHNHDTGMTIGAVHARCNAVLWQYHGE